MLYAPSPHLAAHRAHRRHDTTACSDYASLSPSMSPDDSYERTALWVRAQSTQQVFHSPSTPPSLGRSSTTTKSASTHRTTTSSEAMSLRPSLSHTAPTMQPSTHPPPPSTRATPSTHTRAPSTSTHRPRYDSRTRHSSFPFPQSPPGSGYPVAMDVAVPRRQMAEAEEKQASRNTSSEIASDRCDHGRLQLPRPPFRKERRPSLIEQIKHLGTPGHRRRDSESGKKA